ncbi:hypothetical protein BO71DRAFT_428949 [Aspergillus ellipticus CBS 707.79]|uniref:Uncharacterized protein n=1 Tax=Aspergillus ellipticus CBS 707.79 TaxID=1448320 RepID=A0A319DE45_9EURO|nr:hypothetical protein BO71DRAFT_428949 [Aspergillus ellipticus CBS 707.79]
MDDGGNSARDLGPRTNVISQPGYIIKIKLVDQRDYKLLLGCIAITGLVTHGSMLTVQLHSIHTPSPLSQEQ